MLVPLPDMLFHRSEHCFISEVAWQKEYTYPTLPHPQASCLEGGDFFRSTQRVEPACPAKKVEVAP